MSTIKDNKEEIERLRKKIADLEDYKKNIPGWQSRYDKLMKERDDYLKRTRPTRNDCQEMIYEYEKEIVELQKKNQLDIPKKVQEWFAKYGVGISFGYGGIKIVWVSEDHKWVIITNKGGTAGTGTAMGTGSYYYAPTQHWLATTKLGGYLNRPNNHFSQFEGRLTKEKKQELINQIPALEKELFT